LNIELLQFRDFENAQWKALTRIQFKPLYAETNNFEIIFQTH